MAKRGFSSLYAYRAVTNGRIYFNVSKDGQNLGDLVFEVSLYYFAYYFLLKKLFDNQSPKLTENFRNYVTGEHHSGKSLKGTTLNWGFPGFAVKGGKIENDDSAQLPDENL